VSIIVGGTIGLLLYYGQFGLFPELKEFSLVVLISSLMAIPLSWLVQYVSEKLKGVLSWEENPTLRFTAEFLLNTALVVAIASVLMLIILLFATGENAGELWDFYKQSFIRLGILITVATLFYSILSMMAYSYYHYSEGQIADIKLNRKQLKLQFEALRNQLSPHYLFNSLNTISSLIHKNPDKAEAYIRRLADTYSYVLLTKDRTLVTLEDEIEFVKSYFYLLRVRYDEGLNMEFNVPEQLKAYHIPPLTLQILVENAVKHNEFSSVEPLSIYLGAIDNKSLRITNNKTVQPADVTSSRIGLKNIQQRYAFFTKDKIKINDSEQFEVIIPLLAKQAS
jgi:two-component system LytT family sensor kinase